MKIFTAFLRVALLLIWIIVMIIADWNTSNFEFLTWLSIVITAIYFMIMTQFWIDSIWCPMNWCVVRNKK